MSFGATADRRRTAARKHTATLHKCPICGKEIRGNAFGLHYRYRGYWRDGVRECSATGMTREELEAAGASKDTVEAGELMDGNPSGRTSRGPTMPTADNRPVDAGPPPMTLEEAIWRLRPEQLGWMIPDQVSLGLVLDAACRQVDAEGMVLADPGFIVRASDALALLTDPAARLALISAASRMEVEGNPTTAFLLRRLAAASDEGTPNG